MRAELREIADSLVQSLRRMVEATERRVDAQVVGIQAQVSAVEQSVAALPVPRDGKDADPVSDDQLAAVVSRHFEEHPVLPGRDADPVSTEQLVSAVALHLADNPPAPGRDGKDAEPISVEQIREVVARHLEANPPAPGKDAPPVAEEVVAAVVARHLEAHPPAPGRDGKDAEPVSEEAVATVVARHLEAHPPAPGRDADPVDVQAVIRGLTDTARAEVAAVVAKHLANNPPAPGRDGKDADPINDAFVVDTIDRAIERHVGTWALDFERRAQDLFLKAIERIPKPQDGLGFEDMTVDYDGERLVTLRFERDGIVKEFPLHMPTVLDRGVFVVGKAYERSDAVTWAGNYWIAQRATQSKPGDAEDEGAWRLAVRRGRDGKDLSKGTPK